MKTKTTFSKVLAWGLTFALVLTLVPPFTLTASAATTHTVTFDRNGATNIDGTSRDVPDGESIETAGLAFPIATTWASRGYTFNGYNTAANGSGDPFTADTIVTGDITVYAQWELITYNITYVLDGGVNNASNPTAHNAHTSMADLKLKDPTRTGYTFLGWTTPDLPPPTLATTPTPSSEILFLVGGLMSNKTFTAHWAITYHQVNFNPNYTGNDVPGTTPREVADGEPLGTLPNVTREGYTLVGWFDTADADGGTEYTAETPITKDVTLHARWTAIVYTITYELGGGTNHGSNPARYTIASTLITLQAPTRPGYTFTGWTWGGLTIPDSTAHIDEGSTGNRTFTAHWEINKYTVTFDSQGGSTVPNITNVNYGSAISPPPAPTYAGHTFDGWFTAATGGTAFNFLLPITDDITLYAQWAALPTHTLAYDENGASGTVPTNSLGYVGEPIEIKGINTLNFTGKTFAGWSKNADGLGVLYYPGQTITLTVDTMLYAIWVDDGSAVSVTGIGIDNDDFSLSVGETKDLTVTLNPSDATNKGVTWSSNNESVATVSGGRVTAVSEGTATITATSVAGSYTDTVEVTVTAAFIPVNQITGVNTEPFTAGTPHTLGGTVYPTTATNKTITWSIVSGANASVNSGVVTATGEGTVTVRATIANGLTDTTDYTQDFTITVLPSPTVTVIFDHNYTGGPANITIPVNTGNAIGTTAFPPNPTRTGYTFAGWYTTSAAEGGIQFTADRIVSGPMTVYARWTASSPPSTTFVPCGSNCKGEGLCDKPCVSGGGNNNSGSSGSGGSYIPTQPSTPPPTPNTIPGSAIGTDATTNIPVTVNSNTGTVRVNLDTATTEALIEKATSAAEETDEDTTPTVTLDLSEVEGAASVALNVEAAQSFSEAEVAVTVILPDAEITLAPEALAILADETEAGETLITVEAAIIPMSELQGMQAAQVKGYETVVSIDVFVGETKVDVPLTVSLPYTLKANENPAAVRVWYMDDQGNLTDLNGVFDSTTGMITFTITHQSYFVVGYDEVSLWENLFGDVSIEDWFYSAVAYVSHYGYVSGDGAGSFFPNVTLTRAQLATLLWNLEGKPIADGENPFTDVEAGVWYEAAVTWAADNDIVRGDGEGSFLPEKTITRQEMIQMLYNYAVNFKGYEIPVHQELPAYGDLDEVVAWAETAAKALAEAGVLTGLPEGDGELKPDEDASRADAALLLMNFIRFIAGE